MNDHFDSLMRGGPIAGIAMTVAGVAGYLHHAFGRAMDGASSIAHVLLPGGWTWDSIGQNISAALVVTGAVVTAVSSWNNRRRDDLRAHDIKDKLANIEVFKAQVLADIEVRHAEQAAHLGRQDEVLAEIKNAVVASKPSDNP